MRRTLGLLYAASVFPPGAGGQSPGSSPAVVYVATYVEVLPGSVGNAMASLQRYRDATRKEEGNLRTELVQEENRPARFAVLSVWSDAKAFEAHGAAAHTVPFRVAFKPLQAAPDDERINSDLHIDPRTAVGSGALFVLTHVDVPPPFKDALLPMLRQLTEDNRAAPGNLRFDVQQQVSRPNHFTSVEVWADRGAFDANVASAQKRRFREGFAPMVGALYDERLYHAVE